MASAAIALASVASALAALASADAAPRACRRSSSSSSAVNPWSQPGNPVELQSSPSEDSAPAGR